MRYLASENDILVTLHDFEALCTYIEENRPFLTTKGDLSTKACFDVNSLMARPDRSAKKSDRMGKYWTISLYFSLARESGLIEPETISSQKAVIRLSDKYPAYQKMSGFSKYLFLFLTWMRETNIEELYGDRSMMKFFGASILDRAFHQLEETDPAVKFTRIAEQSVFDRLEHPLLTLMEACPMVLRHFRDFGIIAYDDADEIVAGAYESRINAFVPTLFGTNLARACNLRRFTWVNRWEEWILTLDEDAEELEAFEEEYEKNAPGTEGFFAPFLSCFPQGSVDISALNALLFPPNSGALDNALYVFKVALSGKCYRVIHCAGSHTFEDLHLAIQEAFGFDDDHLYSFFLDGKKWSRRSINSPYAEEPPYADEVKIGEADLREKQTVLYLFDYGDEWRFSVTFLSVEQTDISLRNPKMMDAVGKSPEQYA